MRGGGGACRCAPSWSCGGGDDCRCFVRYSDARDELCCLFFAGSGPDQAVVENPQHAYRRRYQQGPMRVESSTMSDPSCGLQRAALGDECVAEGSEGEDQQTTPTLDRRTEEEEEEEDEMTKSVNLHRELATKRREVSHLVDEMQRLQSSINNLKEMSTSKIAQLQDMVSEKDRVIKDLAEKLLRQQDYTDLKRELRLLKALDAGAWQTWNSEPLEVESPTNDKNDDTNGNRMTPTSGDESLGEDPAPSSTPPAADSASTAHLQRCLRLNVDRFGCEPLNTLSVSRCVRELLSVNNIGQRLFAKLVLGLSQGTVSELLSKPKPWDKLTEKGRDSYRKMHAWACDQQCVMLLKAMLPKKGRDGKIENEDRQVQTSSEVTTSVPPTSEENNVSGNTVEVSTPSKEVRPHTHHHPMGHNINYADVGNGKGLCHFAEFPPVMLAHLYQEELLKLIGKRMKDCQQPAEQAKQAEEEIRRALSIYHRELTMMAAHQCHARRPDSTCGVQTAYGCREPACCMTQQPGEHGSYFPSDSMKVLSPYSSGSPLIPLPPEGSQQAMPGGEDTSPLQRMQSITNSLLAAAGQGFGAQQFAQQRPSKAVLPPITQQQFDHYSNLNTEDIVKRVKEQLSQYSISQRLFGESVLGLSQGSVSDLLARPKPWHMLTQKGREPFIRMKMFLEDENAVHKLVASQYKIAPERLMRMGGYGGVPVTPGMMGSNRYSPIGTAAEPSYPSPRTGGPQPKLPRPCSPPSSPSAPLSPSAGRGARGPFVQPSVYEMAAVTTDLDTQIITARIKETLTVHNIGQKLFGEAVLGLSQGSVSELLSKPKPWHMLSIKGREPFIRMQLWLNDPANVEKLQAIKTERREANKRRRNALDSDSSCASDQPQQQAPCPLDASLFLYPPSSKKPRMLFSEEQKEALKLAYTLDPYPSTAVMEFLSAELGLSVRTITNWFHNHRMRLKQQNQEPDVPYPNPESVPSTFDPIRFRLLLGQRLAEMCKASNQMLPYFSVPPFGVSQTVGKLEAENTLDLSVSSQQYPKKEMEKEDEDDKKLNSPKPPPTTPIDLTDKNANKEIDLTDSVRADKFSMRNSPSEFPSMASAKSSLDLSFSTLQKLTVQELASSVTTTPADTTSRNSTPEIDSLFRNTTKQEEDFPVDLREDKRCMPMNSGSNRRKPAAPQWVDPGLDLSPDSDIFEEEPQDNPQDPGVSGQVINGICVRQSDSFQERMKLFHCSRSNEDEKSKLEREQNIRRLERAIADHEEGWDDISDDDDVCL